MTLIWRTCKFAQFTERIQTSHSTNTGYLSFLGNVKNWKIPAHNLLTSIHPLTTFKLKRLSHNPDRLKAIQDIYQFPSFCLLCSFSRTVPTFSPEGIQMEHNLHWKDIAPVSQREHNNCIFACKVLESCPTLLSLCHAQNDGERAERTRDANLNNSVFTGHPSWWQTAQFRRMCIFTSACVRKHLLLNSLLYKMSGTDLKMLLNI